MTGTFRRYPEISSLNPQMRYFQKIWVTLFFKNKSAEGGQMAADLLVWTKKFTKFCKSLVRLIKTFTISMCWNRLLQVGIQCDSSIFHSVLYFHAVRVLLCVINWRPCTDILIMVVNLRTKMIFQEKSRLLIILEDSLLFNLLQPRSLCF